MKKIQLFVSSLVISSGLWAQQIPTNNSPVGASSGYGSREYWSRAGNSNINGNNNIFGTLWNSPIYTQTNGVNRMKLNGNVSYSINGSNAARNGYLLIGGDMPLWAGGPNELYSNVGAFSLLHLIGDESPFVQEGGKIC